MSSFVFKNVLMVYFVEQVTKINWNKTNGSSIDITNSESDFLNLGLCT